MDNTQHNAQNVICMSDHTPERGYTALAQVEAYWEALRGDRMVPKRSDIDPRGIEGALENAFILERVGPGIARLRVAGSHLTDLMGMEVRGMPLTALFGSAHRQTLSEALDSVFDGPTTAHLTLEAPATPTSAARPAKMVLLPLKSDLGDISRLLGALVCPGAPSDSPSRFEIVDQRFSRILHGTAGPVPAPQTLAPAPPPATAPGPQGQAAGFADKAAPFTPKGKPRPPYLRVVKSDD